MRATTILHPKNTILSCPKCDRRITVALPTIEAICHDRHRATVMVPVADVAEAGAASRP